MDENGNEERFTESVGKRPLGSSRHRWINNIRMDLTEIGIEGTNWIQLLRIEISGEFS